MGEFSQFDLFDSPKYAEDVVEYDELEFVPNNLQGDDNGPYEITVVGNGVHFLQLQKARLEMSLKFNVSDATTLTSIALANKHDASVVPFIASSLFKCIRFKIANIEVPELTQNNYGYKSYIEELLENTQENQKVYLKTKVGQLDDPGIYNTGSSYWKVFGSYSSTGGISNVPKLKTTVTVDNKTINQYDPNETRMAGIWLRNDMFRDNNPLFISTPMHVDFLNQHKCFPPNFSMSFIFERNSAKYYMLSQMGDDAVPSIVIEKMKIVVPIVRLHPDLATKLLSRWNTDPIPYYYQYILPRTYHLASGSLFWEEREISQGILPKSVYFVFVRTSNYNGDYQKSPFLFENLNLTRFELTKNGQVMNSFTLEPDFNTTDGLRAYNHFLKHAKKERENCLITNRMFKTDYTIIPFDLSNDFNHNYNIYEPSFGTLGVNVKFPALPVNYVAIVLFVYNKCLTIDKHLVAKIKDI